jgi:hypothetical protein
MKRAAVKLFRIREDRRRPLGSLDTFRAVDGPVAKHPTRIRVSWLVAHEGAFFLGCVERWIDRDSTVVVWLTQGFRSVVPHPDRT